jgi:hypothetical protein
MEVISMDKPQKRYRIDKLTAYDIKTGLETWTKTSMSSDNLDALDNFIGDDHRVFDTLKNKEVRRNVNLDTWK